MYQQSTLPLPTTSSNPHEHVCQQCGQTFIARLSKNKKAPACCSRECRNRRHVEYWQQRRDAIERSGQKHCNKCNQMLPLDRFRSLVNYKNHKGLATYCRECEYADRRERYKQNPQPYKDYAKEYAATHRDEIRARYHAWSRKNHAHLLARYRKYNEVNREQRRVADRTRRAAMSPEERRSRWKKENASPAALRWRIENRDRIRERVAENGRRWRQQNPEKHTEKEQRRRSRKLNAPIIEIVDRLDIIREHGSICYLCDRPLVRSEITMDHIVPLARGGEHSARNLRPCCQSCNSTKGSRLHSELEERFPDLAVRVEDAVQQSGLIQ